MIHSSVNKKLIFLHNPKVAGCSINSCLIRSIEDYDGDGFQYEARGERIPDSMIQGYQKRIPTEFWDQAFKFAFVRNPYDKFVSGWKYGEKVTGLEIDFEDFVHNLDNYRVHNTITWHTIISQNTHLNYPNTEIYIGKFENLQKEMNTIAQVCDFTLANLTQDNSTQHKNYKEYYNQEFADVIYERFKKDFIYFGYERNSWK